MSGKNCDKSAVMLSESRHARARSEPASVGAVNDVFYTNGNIDDIFRCLSRICSGNGPGGPQKSDPSYRRAPPIIRLAEGRFDPGEPGRPEVSFHLPRDLGALYSAAPLAYYLGASIDAGTAAYIGLNSGERMALPGFPELEVWMGETLRRTFYLDCAVRHASASGSLLNGLDVRKLLGLPPKDILRMGPGQRLLLYSDAPPDIPGLPEWHMAAYLDPVPGSVEALPFLLSALSAIYRPRSAPASEKGVVAMSIRGFLGREKRPAAGMSTPDDSVVIPSLRRARSHLWFSGGYPVDATKASVQAFVNGGKYPGAGGKGASVGIICNDDAMSGEVDAIIEALSGTRASIQVNWHSGVSGVAGAFARGFDVLQLIGHCDERGFKCHDGFAGAGDVRENNTPVFFFNSCASYKEAEALVGRGSACGVSTLFRVLEEAAVDVCGNFYRVLGAGYPVSIAMDAARECSALGKEYLLVGDGSYACFGGDGLKPFYRIDRHDGGYTLGFITGNVDKGNMVGAWPPDGERAVSDLGFEERFLSAGRLATMAGKLKGLCLYDHNIFASVEDAARKAVGNGRHRS